MNRPLNWFVVALSLTFLVAGRSMSPAVEPVHAVLVNDDLQARTLSFEPAGRPAVPASMRGKRDLEFGYVPIEEAHSQY
jgi:hypothetical protein